MGPFGVAQAENVGSFGAAQAENLGYFGAAQTEKCEVLRYLPRSLLGNP